MKYLKKLDDLNNNNLEISLDENIILKGRTMALRSFSNVINNGLIYGKKVFVKVKRTSNRVSIIIEDDGPGIPEDQYKNVFKPFFRLDEQ